MNPGHRVKGLREAHGWSQRELGRRARVDHALISRLENGLYPNPGLVVLERLADALHVKPHELIGEAGEVPFAPSRV